MIDLFERKKRIRKIGALCVLGIFVLAMQLPSVIAAPVWQDVPYTDSPRIIIDSDGDQPDQVFAITHNLNKAELFRVQETGEVGIGDTSPDFKLEVTGSSGSGYFGVTSSSDGDIFIIDSNGKVGIGTTSPTYPLDVVGTATISGSLLVDCDLNVDSGTLFVDNDINKVGIGTTNPTGGLDVRLGVTASGGSAKGVNFEQALTASNNNDKLTPVYIKPSYNDGIYTGVTHCALKVEVGSNLGGAAEIGNNLCSATGDFAVAMGDGTTASGDESTAMGWGTTASGDHSVAMGSDGTVASNTCSFANELMR